MRFSASFTHEHFPWLQEEQFADCLDLCMHFLEDSSFFVVCVWVWCVRVCGVLSVGVRCVCAALERGVLFVAFLLFAK